jgi:hypothetical protein
MVFFHEYKTQIYPGSGWLESLKYETAYDISYYLKVYSGEIKYLLYRYDIVGDSNSWDVVRLADVNRKIHIDKVIHLVRNGIQTVHSLYQHNKQCYSRQDWLFTHYLRNYWELAGRPGGNWKDYSEWEAWCLYWSLNPMMAIWLAEQIDTERVLVFRLEDLTEDVNMLVELIRDLNPFVNIDVERLKLLQNKDINRKIYYDRSPGHLWKQWTEEEKTAFLQICGPSMKYYNYPVLSK